MSKKNEKNSEPFTCVQGGRVKDGWVRVGEGWVRVGEGWVRVGEGWAYYLLQYTYFPCKYFSIEKKMKKGTYSEIFFEFFLL
jgi:hypothetical protein